MPVARERLLELSALSGVTARDHFLAITQGGGIIGGRADLVINATNETLLTSDSNELISIAAEDLSITLKADKKGLTV